MNHRHLLPDEIDRMVDGEADAGAGPLRAHLVECGVCAARVHDAGLVAHSLEGLPYHAPAGRLADRVMAHVPVIVPVRMAARETARRLAPRSRSGRLAAAALGIGAAGALSVALASLLVHTDQALTVAGMLLDQLRAGAGAGARQLAVALLGDAGLSGLRSTGAAGASLMVAGFLLGLIATVAGLRYLAATSAGQGS